MATIIVSKNTTGTYTNTGYTGVNDTRTRGLNPTTNYASSTTLDTTCWDLSEQDVTTTFIKFDLTGIGAGTVTNAEFGLWLTVGNHDFLTIDLYALLVDFIDTEATYLIRKTGVDWDEPDARGSGTDRDATPIATATRSSTSDIWMTFSGSGLNALIEDYLDGTRTNNGFTLELTDYADDLFSYQTFASSEGTDGNRPYLKFDHTPSGVSVALTGIGNTYSAGSFSGSVTKALTGSAQTASQGALVKVHSKALTNNAITASQGALASAIAFALTGQAFTYTQGTVTPDATSNINVALTGQQYAFAQGTVSASNSKALTGQQATESAGTLTASTSKAITGQSNTYGIGSVSSVIANAISGASSSYAQGIVSPTGTVNIQLTGSTFTYSAGTLSASSNKSIAGQSATVSQGTLAGLIAKALAGQSQTITQGTLTPEFGVAIQLTGQQASYSQGSLASSIIASLAGSSFAYVAGTINAQTGERRQYPLAGIGQDRPLDVNQQYPLAGINQDRPLG